MLHIQIRNTMICCLSRYVIYSINVVTPLSVCVCVCVCVSVCCQTPHRLLVRLVYFLVEWFGYVRWWFLSNFLVLPPNILSEIAGFPSFLAPNPDIFKRNDIQSIFNRHQKCKPSIQQTETTYADVGQISSWWRVRRMYIDPMLAKVLLLAAFGMKDYILRTFASEINNNSTRLSWGLTFDIETHFT